MAGTELTTFQPGAVPAHIAALAEQLGENTTTRGATVPSLSPQGKVWTIAIDGNKTKLEKRDNDGEIVPIGVMKVVILDFAKSRGRTYYEGAYDPDKEAAPICWSDDGVTPDATVTTRQAPKCGECPKAVKGSKVTDQGKAIAACSQHRMMALIPANKLDFQPLRLKIAITSDWDKEGAAAGANAQQGWYAFQNYLDYIKSMGVAHTALIVTKMKFDSSATYPKILFAVDRWLTPEEVAQVAPLPRTDDVQKLLGGTWTPAGPDGVKKDEQPAAGNSPEPTAGTAAPASTPEPQAASPSPAAEEDDGDDVVIGLDAPAATTAQGGAQGVPVTPAATTASPKAAAAEVQPEVATAKDPALAALLNDWGD